VSEAASCFGTDDIVVRVFKTGPDLFIPSAFTPNNDGKNDILKPVAVGMKGLTFFRIYNRWGQMLFSTSEIGKGWNGTFGGSDQPSGTYVYMAEAVDYLDKKVTKKGTVVLLR
jgi:gliding motility-associated-like protein